MRFLTNESCKTPCGLGLKQYDIKQQHNVIDLWPKCPFGPSVRGQSVRGQSVHFGQSVHGQSVPFGQSVFGQSVHGPNVRGQSVHGPIVFGPNVCGQSATLSQKFWPKCPWPKCDFGPNVTQPYIGLLHTYMFSEIASALASFHQKLTFLAFKSIYSSKGEIQLVLKKVLENQNYRWNENKS